MFGIYSKDKYDGISRQRLCARIVAVPLVSVLLFAATCAKAAPALIEQNVGPLSNRNFPETQSAIEVLKSHDTRLLNIGSEIIKPYVASATPGNSQRGYMESLPAVPAAILMVIAGFLCISLVRDRRVWLAVLAGLLWAGHAGINTVPQLAQSLCLRPHTVQRFLAGHTQAYSPEDANRARCDIEGTRYTGLLHYLAGIPRGKYISQLCFRFKQFGTSTPMRIGDEFEGRQFAVSQMTGTISPICCLAILAERFSCFTPAFTLQGLARGPPVPA